MKKLTITQAAALLEAKGITLVRGLPFDMEAMTARYEVEQNGERRVVSSADVFEMVG